MSTMHSSRNVHRRLLSALITTQPVAASHISIVRLKLRNFGIVYNQITIPGKYFCLMCRCAAFLPIIGSAASPEATRPSPIAGCSGMLGLSQALARITCMGVGDVGSGMWNGC